MALQIKNIILLFIFTLLAIFTYNIANAANNPMIVTVNTNIAKDDIVNKSDLKLVEAPSRNIANSIVTNIDDIAGLQTLRHLRPGMQLHYSYFREMPAVSKKKAVKIIYNVPGIKLESEMMAMQDGQIGDIIKVKNLKSNKILNAEVLDFNLVRIK